MYSVIRPIKFVDIRENCLFTVIFLYLVTGQCVDLCRVTCQTGCSREY